MDKEHDSFIDQFKDDINKCSLDFVVSKWILERIPYIFKENRLDYLKVKSLISDKIKVDSCSIFFVGSCAVGFSLNPNKLFKPFDEHSDIDIAVISHYFFDIAWRTIQDIDFSSISYPIQQIITEHRNKYIYWETVALDKIIGIMPFAKEWMETIERLKSLENLNNRNIAFRLYRNTEALKRYHINNLKTNQTSILGVEPMSVLI